DRAVVAGGVLRFGRLPAGGRTVRGRGRRIELVHRYRSRCGRRKRRRRSAVCDRSGCAARSSALETVKVNMRSRIVSFFVAALLASAATAQTDAVDITAAFIRGGAVIEGLSVVQISDI